MAKVTICRLFGGERVGNVTEHDVTTPAGLLRVLARYKMGGGWGVDVRIKGRANALKLGGREGRDCWYVRIPLTAQDRADAACGDLPALAVTVKP